MAACAGCGWSGECQDPGQWQMGAPGVVDGPEQRDQRRLCADSGGVPASMWHRSRPLGRLRWEPGAALVSAGRAGVLCDLRCNKWRPRGGNGPAVRCKKIVVCFMLGSSSACMRRPRTKASERFPLAVARLNAGLICGDSVVYLFAVCPSVHPSASLLICRPVRDPLPSDPAPAQCQSAAHLCCPLLYTQRRTTQPVL